MQGFLLSSSTDSATPAVIPDLEPSGGSFVWIKDWFCDWNQTLPSLLTSNLANRLIVRRRYYPNIQISFRHCNQILWTEPNLQPNRIEYSANRFATKQKPTLRLRPRGSRSALPPSRADSQWPQRSHFFCENAAEWISREEEQNECRANLADVFLRLFCIFVIGILP